MKAWKKAEKEVAKFFGGVRRVRVSYSEAIGDIIHPHYSIEVKYGNQVPKCLSPQLPTKLWVGDKTYHIVPSTLCNMSKDMLYYRCIAWVGKRRARCVFLDDAMNQAKRYNKSLLPMVCVKPRNRRGFIIIWEV